MDADIITIGAGPAGSTFSSIVARAGFSVLLVDKECFPRDKVCGGGIINQSDFIPTDVIDKKIKSSIFHFPWGIKEYKKYHGISFSRRVFDSHLLNEAKNHGAIFHENLKAQKIVKSKEGIIVHLRGQKSRVQHIKKTNLVTFCDGANTLARTYGFGFERRPDSTGISAIYEIEWKDNPLNKFEFYSGVDITPWGYGWVFPKKDTVNVGIFCLLSLLKHDIKKYLDNFIKNTTISKTFQEKKILKFGSALIPLCHTKKMVRNKMLAIGDSAGMVDPIWGGGIKYAISGAKIAAKVAIECLNEERFDEKDLHQYEKHWKQTDEYAILRKHHLISEITKRLWLSVDKNAYSKVISLQTKFSR